MVERFNGRIVSEVLDINIYSHRALEQLLRGFNAAYNTRRQRVLDGKTPNQVVTEHLQARPRYANTKATGQAGPAIPPRLASSLKPQRRSHNQTSLLARSLVSLPPTPNRSPQRLQQNRFKWQCGEGDVGRVRQAPERDQLPRSH